MSQELFTARQRFPQGPCRGANCYSSMMSAQLARLWKPVQRLCLPQEHVQSGDWYLRAHLEEKRDLAASLLSVPRCDLIINSQQSSHFLKIKHYLALSKEIMSLMQILQPTLAILGSRSSIQTQ